MDSHPGGGRGRGRSSYDEVEEVEEDEQIGEFEVDRVSDGLECSYKSRLALLSYELGLDTNRRKLSRDSLIDGLKGFVIHPDNRSGKSGIRRMHHGYRIVMRTLHQHLDGVSDYVHGERGERATKLRVTLATIATCRYIATCRRPYNPPMMICPYAEFICRIHLCANHRHMQTLSLRVDSIATCM